MRQTWRQKRFPAKTRRHYLAKGSNSTSYSEHSPTESTKRFLLLILHDLFLVTGVYVMQNELVSAVERWNRLLKVHRYTKILWKENIWWPIILVHPLNNHSVLFGCVVRWPVLWHRYIATRIYRNIYEYVHALRTENLAVFVLVCLCSILECHHQ